MASYLVTFNERPGSGIAYPGLFIPEGEHAANYAPDVADYVEGKYIYRFVGWEPELGPVTGNITYNAVFEKAYNAPPLQRAVETYGKQIDLTITRTEGAEATASGEAVVIDDAYVYDNSLSVKVRSKNLLDLGNYTTKAYAVYDETNQTITSSFTDLYYSYLQYTYLNDTLMSLRGKTLTLSVKSIPEGTTMTWIVYGTRTSGKTNQECSKGSREVSGVLASDFTSITGLEIRVNRKGAPHTAENVLFEEFQFEIGETATAYTSYVPDLSAVSVKRTSKNLFDYTKHTNTTQVKYIGEGVFAPPYYNATTATNKEYLAFIINDAWDIANTTGKQFAISFDLKTAIDGNVAIYALGGRTFKGGSEKNAASTTEWQRFSFTFSTTYKENDPNGEDCILSFYGTYGSGVLPFVRNVQIELGEEATELAEYVAETATADTDGAVTTLTTLTPTTVLSSDTTGIILDAVYQKAVKTTYTSGDIVACNISYNGAFLTSVMREADIELEGVGGADFATSMRGANLGIVLTVTANGEAVQKDFGTFFVKESEYDDDKNSVKLTCYDQMLFAMVPYIPTSDFTNTVTLGDFFQNICNYLGLKLATPTFHNSDVEIDGEKYDDQYTFRDALTEIAQAAGGTIAIKDGALHVLYPTETDVILSPSNMRTITIGEKYGAVGTVVLARTPQNDNIFMTNAWAKGDAVVTIENNQLMDSHRDDFMNGLLDALLNLEYYPFEAESFGILCLDLCDVFVLQDLDGTEHKAIFLASELEISQGLIETASAGTPSGAKEDYAAASSTDRAINKTNLRVDKQEQKIEALVSTTTEQYNELTGKTDELTKKVEMTVTAEEVNIKITEAVEGIDSIETSTGYTFDHDGLYIHKDGDEIENKIDNTGMYVNRNDENVLTANNEGVEAINLKSRQFLIIGSNSRFEDYEGNRTACFYIGG